MNWTHRNSQRIGVALADSPDGPWLRFDRPLLEPTPGFHDALCCANPSVTERFGGGYLMVYKAVDDKGRLPFGGPVSHCVATSESPRGPFEKRPDRIFCKEGVFFPAEDPFIWRDDWRYWAIVKDYNGSFTGNGKSLALFESDDGFDWKPSGNVLVSTLQIRWADGNVQKLQMLERPQLYIEEGRPLVLLCAAMDTNGNTFNVQIPLEDGAAESREFGR